MKKIFLLATLLLQAACSSEEQPKAPTAAESERLNEAEELLNELGNNEGAAPEGTGPAENLN